MEPYPPSSSLLLHQDDADDKKKLRAAYRRKRQHDTVLHRFNNVYLIVLWMLVIYLPYDMPPEFSVQLEAIKGLDATTSNSGGTSLSSAFSLTLHDHNRRLTGRCYHDGEALVSYGGFTIATGRVPGFCVSGKGNREVRFLVSAHGVGLPEHVLDRMALERRVGATQLDVEVKLFRRDDGSDRPIWLWCGQRMDGAQPPNVTPCTVLGLQNWLSYSVS